MTAEEFIAKWKSSGGNERANTQMFVSDLCDLLELPKPQPTQPDMGANDYVFERHVIKEEIGGGTSSGWIDLYKRDCFILEAKQGSARDAEAVDQGLGQSLRDLFGQTAADRFKRGMAKRGTGQWASAMQRAAGQAEGYAKALPKNHGWPPFLLASDVGYCIDVYANFARDGRSYAPFPDRRKFRIELDDLRNEEVRKRLRAMWLDPMSLDPSAEAARVTREVAAHLAALAKDIEEREQNPDRVAAFLMRLLFTMFAEDTGLIPKESFSELLKHHRDEPEILGLQLSSLWADMDAGGFASSIAKKITRFNGWLFKDQTALDLTSSEIDVLIEAAEAKWDHVEPAIFGTLLERALNPKERAKLGAHYTPRAYVERLVQPTIIDPLRDDWLGARTAAMESADGGDKEKARRLVEEFHGKLARTKVLDPACGTGNFLYVAMARMKELEGEVLELLEELGDRQYLAEISGHTITPENFLGIEVNPRAAEIAQLVLWIGYLQWHFRVNGENRMPEPPVLRNVKTIECRDALITWDRRELERDEHGVPVTRWDGDTMRKHPVTGKDVPDETARVEVYRYVNPKPAKWPSAEFIVGNPPFIGVRRMKTQLSDSYVNALRMAYSSLPGTLDLVMYWWDHAASLVRGGSARRFGMIATNSIVQDYSRPVLEKHINAAKNPLILVFAVTNHPWVENKDGAAVDVAMVAAASENENVKPLILEVRRRGRAYEIKDHAVQRINASLRNIPDVFAAKALKANMKMCFQGVVPAGDGFKLEQVPEKATGASVIKPYMIGDDLTERMQSGFIVDFFGMSSAQAEAENSWAFSKILSEVKPERDQNSRQAYREKWWLFAEPRPALRRATAGLVRYIGTPYTARHRPFVFLPAKIIPDAMIYVIASEDAYLLGCLSSSIHATWCRYAGGTLQDRPRYNSDRTFLPFPFPGTSDEALKDRIRDAAEKLDGLRKDLLARHDDLTITALYNTLEALREADAAGTVLGDKDRDLAERGCISLIRQYHNEIDDAVAEAYGWPAQLSDEAILERIVALNNERMAEEAKGKVRWLRPEFQQPGYVAPAEQVAMPLPELAKAATELEWPAKLSEQVVAVAGIVERAGRPIAANDVARAFKSKRAVTVAPVLDALSGMGRLRKLQDGRYAA